MGVIFLYFFYNAGINLFFYFFDTKKHEQRLLNNPLTLSFVLEEIKDRRVIYLTVDGKEQRCSPATKVGCQTSFFDQNFHCNVWPEYTTLRILRVWSYPHCVLEKDYTACSFMD